MALIFVLFLSIASSLQELDPVSDQERNDEVSESEKRSVWISCLFLTFLKLEDIPQTIKNIKSLSNYSESEIRKAIALDILLKCTSSLNFAEAEKILADENLDLESPEMQELLYINTEQFKGELVYSKEKLELLAKIEQEIQLNEEEIIPPPPQTIGYEIYEPSVFEEIDSNYVAIAFAIFILSVTFLLYKKKKIKLAEPSRKKKNN